MSYELTITVKGDTAEEVREQTQALFGTLLDKKAPAPKKAADPATPAQAAATLPGAITQPAAPPPTPAPAAGNGNGEITLTTISEIIPKLVAKLGKTSAVAILAEFGVKKGGELKVEQYAGFMARANAALV